MFPRRKTEHKAVRLLIEYEYVQADDVKEGKRIKIPDELRADAVFQTLCRKIEEADIEIAERSVQALETASPATVTNPFFSGMTLPGAAPTPHKQHHKTIRDLADAFLSQKEGEGIGKSRINQYRIPIRLLEE